MKAVLRRILITLIGAMMLGAAAGTLVFALAFAMFALLQPRLGGAGAGAGVALAAAVLMGGLGLFLDRYLLRPVKPKAKGEDDKDLVQKLMGMAQERPLIAAGAVAGLIFMAVRNPALVAILAKSFLDPAPRPGKKKA